MTMTTERFEFDRSSDIVGLQQPATFRHRGYSLRVQDVNRRRVSGSFGYQFALVADGPDATAPFYDTEFARSVFVWLRCEENKAGSAGCGSGRWFRDADVESAQRAFREAVDSYLD